MNRAACYIRVSSNEQANNGSSLDNQLHLIKNYALSKGFEIVEFVQDAGISAFRKKSRPGFNRIMELIQIKAVDHVIVYSLSRFARNTRVTLDAVEMMIKNEISFHSITEDMNTSTPHGRFVISLLSSLAQLESEQTGERVKSVKKYCKENNRTYTSPVFGFDNKFEYDESGKKKSGKMIPNEKEMEVVKQIVTTYQTGASPEQIAWLLNSEKIPTKRNSEWHPSTVRYIIKNPIYKNLIAA